MKHGKRFEVLGFRFGNVAYCTDVNAIPPESMEQLTGLDVLVLDALRPRGHATHFSLEEAVEVARQLAPRQTYFTHMSHELEHEATNARCRRDGAGVRRAADCADVNCSANASHARRSQRWQRVDGLHTRLPFVGPVLLRQAASALAWRERSR